MTMGPREQHLLCSLTIPMKLLGPHGTLLTSLGQDLQILTVSHCNPLIHSSQLSDCLCLRIVYDLGN